MWKVLFLILGIGSLASVKTPGAEVSRAGQPKLCFGTGHMQSAERGHFDFQCIEGGRIFSVSLEIKDLADLIYRMAAEYGLQYVGFAKQPISLTQTDPGGGRSVDYSAGRGGAVSISLPQTNHYKINPQFDVFSDQIAGQFIDDFRVNPFDQFGPPRSSEQADPEQLRIEVPDERGTISFLREGKVLRDTHGEDAAPNVFYSVLAPTERTLRVRYAVEVDGRPYETTLPEVTVDATQWLAVRFYWAQVPGTRTVELRGAQKLEKRAPVSASIRVYVPDGAKIYVNGEPTQSRGEARKFTTPPLEWGSTYQYTFKVVSNGVAKEKNVAFKAGESKEIDFRDDF